MYREEVLEHYRKPRNTGEPEDLGDYLEEEGDNPSCGDSTRVYVQMDGDTITDIKHVTDACAIATAGISILSKVLTGMERDEVSELDRDWVMDQLGVDVSPMRVKCAVLGLKTVQSALDT